MVWDAGTEVNDEVPQNTAFLGQTVANTGVNENGEVHPHPGFMAGGNILSAPGFQNADFTRAGYPIAHIQVNQVPLPGALVMLGSGLLGLIGWRRRFR